jgi:hypothetical protein
MSKNKTTTATTNTGAPAKVKKPHIKLADQMAQLGAMAESDETVRALLPAIEAAIQAVEESKPMVKRAKRRLRKLVQAAFSGIE